MSKPKVVIKNDDDMEADADGEKHVGYVLLQKMGSNDEGDCVYLPEGVGSALVEAGVARLAAAEDMDEEVEDEEDEMEMDDEPMIANAVDKLTNKITKQASEAVAKAMDTQKKVTKETAPVEVKSKPYASTAQFIRDACRLELNPGNTEIRNKIAAYQREANRAWQAMGVDTRLNKQEKSILGINETTNSQGGYLVNPEFSPDVYAIPHTQLDLQAMADQIDAKSLIYNQRFVNESSLANGSIFGGLNMVATAEGASFTSSLPAWANVAFQLQKLAIFAYFTTEVLEDASYPIEAELDEYSRKAFLYGINSQIVQGSTLEGFLNTPALVTVTSSSNDTAWHTTPSTSLTYADLASIWAAVYPDSQSSAKGIWLFHPSLANPLVQMTYTFTGAAPAWGIQYNAEVGLEGNGPGIPPGTPYKIFGKPAYPSWACSAPGVAGDILYVDFSTVKNYRRPFRVETSKDYQFGTDQVAVRWVSRLDCRTVFRNKVTGPTGTQQFSAIVTRSSSGT